MNRQLSFFIVVLALSGWTSASALLAQGVDDPVINTSTSGGDIWTGGDDFSFDYTELSGDFDVAIEIVDYEHSTGAGRWGKMGLMARRELTRDSEFMQTQFHGPANDDVARQAGRREHGVAGGGMYEVVMDGAGPRPLAIRLTRRGNEFQSWWAPAVPDDPYEDDEWTPGHLEFRDTMPETVYVGFANSEHNSDGFAAQSVSYYSLNDDFNDINGEFIGNDAGGGSNTLMPGDEPGEGWDPCGNGDFDDREGLVPDFDRGNVTNISTGGGDIWTNGDDFSFDYAELTGDFDVAIGLVEYSHENGVGRWGKMGLMARRELTRDSEFFMTQFHGPSDEDQARTASRRIHGQAGGDGNMYETILPGGSGPRPVATRLTRRGNVFQSWWAAEIPADPYDDASWVCGPRDARDTMPETIFVGFANSEKDENGPEVQTVVYTSFNDDFNEVNGAFVGTDLGGGSVTLMPGDEPIDPGGGDPGGVDGEPDFDRGTVSNTSTTGGDIWTGGDDFTFDYTELTGDFDVAMEILEYTHATGAGRWGKLGLMARRELTRDSEFLMTQFHGPSNEDIARQAGRRQHGNAGGGMYEIIMAGNPGPRPAVIRLTRRGDNFQSWWAAEVPDDPFDDAGWIAGPREVRATMPETIFVGFANSDHNSDGAIAQTVVYNSFNDDFNEVNGEVVGNDLGGGSVTLMPGDEPIDPGGGDPGGGDPVGEPCFERGEVINTSSTGGDIWTGGDDFNFDYTEFAGDFDVAVGILDYFHDTGAGRWGKMGLMARRELTRDSEFVMVQIHGPATDDQARQAGRREHGNAGGGMYETILPGGSGARPAAIRLTRRGNFFQSWWAAELPDDPYDDSSWIEGPIENSATMPDAVFVGFANSEHNSDGAIAQTVVYTSVNDDFNEINGEVIGNDVGGQSETLMPDVGPDPCGGEPGDEICDNGEDDDGDGLADCEDSDCACKPPAEVCDNGIDDDGDGAADCEDADCAEDASCRPAIEICDNGIDDDGDGSADCDDNDCSDEAACKAPVGVLFVRGDSNSDGVVNLTDGVIPLLFLFSGGRPPVCADAADTNDTGAIEITDSIIIFSWLFVGGAPPAPPAPESPGYSSAECGTDPTEDGIGCGVTSAICQ